jgi:hypothetical protein
MQYVWRWSVIKMLFAGLFKVKYKITILFQFYNVSSVLETYIMWLLEEVLGQGPPGMGWVRRSATWQILEWLTQKSLSRGIFLIRHCCSYTDTILPLLVISLVIFSLCPKILISCSTYNIVSPQMTSASDASVLVLVIDICMIWIVTIQLAFNPPVIFLFICLLVVFRSAFSFFFL